MLVTAAIVAAATAPAGWAPDVAAAQRVAARRPAGSISFAVRTPDRLWGRNLDHRVNSVSTVKVLLMLTRLRQRKPIAEPERRRIAAMVRRSDNDAASRLVVELGERKIEWTAKRAGMHAFDLRHPWGASSLTARDGTRLMLNLERLLPAGRRAPALRLLADIVPSQRWGVAKVAPAGWTLHFKGGWGSGSGAADHQIALLARGPQRVAVAVLTTSNPSHKTGSETLRLVFRPLVRGLAASRPAPAAP